MSSTLFSDRVKLQYRSDKAFGKPDKIKILKNGDIVFRTFLAKKTISNIDIKTIAYKNEHAGILKHQRSLAIELNNGSKATVRLLMYKGMKLEAILADKFGDRFNQA